MEKLLEACEKKQFSITREELEEVVDRNDKKRFSFDENKQKIRANQGHSIEIDLELKSKIPPELVYHGTSEQNIDSILQKGLLKMSRHHVHLCVDIEQAKKVGQRKGKPVVFQIEAKNMTKKGYIFYCSDNGVWLVDHVPPEYLKLL